jgi:signal transduction histidine kinase
MNNTILIVDDEDSLRLTLRLRLSAQGFTVLEAEDGEAALEQLKNNAIDLILLDINMPRMDGIEALGHITEMYPGVDVMMLTGFADFTTAIECLKKGAKDYLVKPIEVTELITRVRTALRARSSERALHDMQVMFMSTFLHDMLNPLKTIGSTVEQVKEGSIGSLSDDQNVLLSYVTDLSDRLVKRVKNAIDLTLFEEGKIVLDRHPLDVEMFIQTVCLRYEIIARKKKVTFQKNIQKGLPQASLDFDRFDTVVNCLLDNAMKYTNEKGTVSIAVTSGTFQANGLSFDGINIVVKDSGSGIAPDEVATLFSKFKPGLSAQEQKITAFSLAIAKHIVESHGGTIGVSSEVNKGSTFSVVMPLH